MDPGAHGSLSTSPYVGIDRHRIEQATQVMRHARRAAELVDESFPGAGLVAALLMDLAEARSNDPALGAGREICERATQLAR